MDTDKNPNRNNGIKTMLDPIIDNLENLVRHTKGAVAALKKIREEAKKFPRMLKF